jgi:hypothetical protein
LFDALLQVSAGIARDTLKAPKMTTKRFQNDKKQIENEHKNRSSFSIPLDANVVKSKDFQSPSEADPGTCKPCFSQLLN